MSVNSLRLRIPSWITVPLTIMALLVGPAHGGDYRPGPGPLAVVAEDRTWTDQVRDLPIPIRVFAPDLKAGIGPFPLMLISHGGGESRHSFEYLGQYWASYGYLVVVANHVDSDDAAYRRVVEQKHMMPRGMEKYDQRNETFQFLLDRLLSKQLDDPLLKGRIDPERVGVSGQCAGSTTVLISVGLTVPPDLSQNLANIPFPAQHVDKRVRAVVAMGPQVKWSWDKISPDVPILYVVGTDDFDWMPQVKSNPQIVREPYERTPGPDKYLVTLKGAKHYAFTDSAAPGYAAYLPVKKRDPRHHACIQQASTAFLDAYLKGDAAALDWLQAGKLEATGEGLCIQEERLKGN